MKALFIMIVTTLAVDASASSLRAPASCQTLNDKPLVGINTNPPQEENQSVNLPGHQTGRPRTQTRTGK